MWTFLSGVTIVGYLLTFLLIPWVLLTRKRNSVSTVAWIMAIVVLPYLGGMLFIIFGINRVERRAMHKQMSNISIARRLPELSQYELIPGEVLDTQQERLMRLAKRVGGTRPTFGNKIDVLADTNQTQALIEQAILAAQETLHLEYYIWQPDKTGTRVRDLLIQKAKEGVAVRFLYDKIGSMSLSRKFLHAMEKEGIRVASFLPGQSLRERWSINLCNHRKIVIVDGRIGFTGGMNIGDEYLGKDPRLGYWRDTHLRLEGAVVLQLQQVFAEDWYYATGEELTHPNLFPQPERSGSISAQVVAGGPDGEVEVFPTLMFAAINEAHSHVTLATSYFVPPAALVAALEAAAYRGLRVRLLVAGKSDHHFTVLAGRSYYDTLLRAGVEIYEYQRGLLHCKVLTVDGNWSLVGSPNFDYRSLMLNFEVAVVMYDDRVAVQLQQQFEEDLKYSQKIDATTWDDRPLRQVASENVCRLFAPVL